VKQVDNAPFLQILRCAAPKIVDVALLYKYCGALHLKSLMWPLSANIAACCTWKSFDVASVCKYCGALHLEIV
jgi:hypothetical protein